MAEEGALRCMASEVVVAERLAVEDDLFAFRIHLGHFPQQHLHIALNTSSSRRGVATSPRETNLVKPGKQRLES